jgi:hypothetical protein
MLEKHERRVKLYGIPLLFCPAIAPPPLELLTQRYFN